MQWTGDSRRGADLGTRTGRIRRGPGNQAGRALRGLDHVARPHEGENLRQNQHQDADGDDHQNPDGLFRQPLLSLPVDVATLTLLAPPHPGGQASRRAAGTRLGFRRDRLAAFLANPFCHRPGFRAAAGHALHGNAVLASPRADRVPSPRRRLVTQPRTIAYSAVTCLGAAGDQHADSQCDYAQREVSRNG